MTTNFKQTNFYTMRTNTILKNALLILLTGTAIISCNDQEPELEVLADVYVINKKFDSEVRSAIAYYAYANQALSEATVTLPIDGGIVELENNPGSVYTFDKVPENSDYKTIAPVEGSYIFNIKGGKGETLQATDILNYDGMDIPEFTSITFSGTPLTLELEWNDITGADGYVVKMFDLNGKLIFNGYSVGENVNKYTITSSSYSGYWSETVVDGESYLLQLNAFSYDSNSNNSYSDYEIKEVSISETQIEWGVN